MDTETLRNEVLEVCLDPETLQFSVCHLDSGVRWISGSNPDGDLQVAHGSTDTAAHLSDARRKVVHRFSTASEERVGVSVTGLPGGVGLSLTFALAPRSDGLRIEVAPLPTVSPSCITTVWYPGALTLDAGEMDYTVWPNGAGTIIPSYHPQEISAATPLYVGGDVVRLPYALAYTHPLYQPWWGVVGCKGSYMAIAETPFDFALDLRHPPGGPTLARPVWVPSLGRLSYPRSIRYRFMREGSYVTLAKAYREYVQRAGRWVSLDAKLEGCPALKELIGTIIFPLSICRHDTRRAASPQEVVSFAERAAQVADLRALGCERAYLHVDGWGLRGYDNYHPDVLPPCPAAGGWSGLIALSETALECGYLFGLHDQYRDYYLDGPSFSESHAVKGPDGRLPQWSRWAGGPQAVLCAKEALPFVRHNFAELLHRGVRLTASYLDVFAIVPLDECYDPQHPMTREDCYLWRAKALDHVRGLGLATSSEEPVDCFMPHLGFAHWAPYPCEDYRYRTGEYWGIPVPLHNLVYHDALLLPATFDYGGSSDLRSRQFLEGLSQVEIPYGRIESRSREYLRTLGILAQLHSAWATHELLDHRLLDPDGMRQQFEYPEGRVWIDLHDLSYRIEGSPVATDGWARVGL